MERYYPLRIIVHIQFTPHFNPFPPYLNKYKKLVKSKVETLLQENLFLNETDLNENDDPLSTLLDVPNETIMILVFLKN